MGAVVPDSRDSSKTAPFISDPQSVVGSDCGKSRRQVERRSADDFLSREIPWQPSQPLPRSFLKHGRNYVLRLIRSYLRLFPSFDVL